MASRMPPLEDVFAALADPTRRAIVERLVGSGELSVGDVAAPFAISGLIERRAERQWRYVRVRADALMPVEGWLSRQRRHWTAALARLEAIAAAQTPKRKKS